MTLAPYQSSELHTALFYLGEANIIFDYIILFTYPLRHTLTSLLHFDRPPGTAKSEHKTLDLDCFISSSIILSFYFYLGTICEALAERMGWDFVVIDTASFLADGL